MSKTDNEKVAYMIRSIRKSKGYTLEEFGGLLSPAATKGNVWNWERGYCKPNEDRRRQIAEIGNISIDELLCEDKVLISKREYEELKGNAYDLR